MTNEEAANVLRIMASGIELKGYTENWISGFKKAYEMAIKVLEDKPQGRWIKIFENPYVNGYVCPFCGHKIQVTEQFLPEVTECEVCGADMKDSAENE